MRRSLLALLVLLALPTVSSADEPDWPPVLTAVVNAGDLDGDGISDLAAAWGTGSYDQEPPIGSRWSTTVNAYRGSDGSTLWSRYLSHGWPTQLIPARVGPEGATGLLVEIQNDRYTDAGTWLATEHHVVALDDGGTIAWRYDVDLVAAMATSQRGELIGAGDLLPGPATDVVIKREASGRTFLDPSPPLDSHVMLVLDGADGTVAASQPQQYSDVHWYSTDVVPDLDGDGYSDIVHRYSGSLLAARSGLDLHELWSRSYVFPDDRRTAPVGDADRDGTGDLLVPNGSDDLVLSGRSGLVLWQGELGSYPLAVGEVDGDGLSDLAGGSWSSAGDEVFVRHRAISATGSGLYDVTYRLAKVPGKSYAAGWDVPGDVDGDGVKDAYQTLRVSGDENLSGVISGRTGGFIWRSRDMPIPGSWLYVSLDGHGVDRLDVSCERAVAYDGFGGEVLWAREVPGCLNLFDPYAPSPGDIDRDGVPDLLFLDMEAGSFTLLSGMDGTTLWSA